MLVQSACLSRVAGKIVIAFFLRFDGPALKKWYFLLQHPCISKGLDIAAGGIGQPEIVIRKARPDSPVTGRMPPVLHVSFLELVCGRTKKMFAQQNRTGVDKGHGVLKLIPESERTSRLVESRAGPKAATDRLIEQPAISQNIQGGMRRFDLNRAERPRPMRTGEIQGIVARSDGAIDMEQIVRHPEIPSRAQLKNDLPF